MRTVIYGILLLLLISFITGSVPNEDRFVIPVENGTPVFLNNPRATDEQPVFAVGTTDRLMVLESKAEVYKVSDLKGNVGWVDKRSVSPIHPTVSMVFGDASIQGYLDNPVPVYILDANNPSAEPLKLERSFAAELKENVDRMTIERIVGEDVAQ